MSRYYVLMLLSNLRLHHTATHHYGNTLQYNAVHCHTLPHTDEVQLSRYCVLMALSNVKIDVSCAEISISCCSVLQCVAVCCSVLQCVAVCCSALQCQQRED